jgi:hypothetical protein
VGQFSSKTIVYPDGSTNVFNAALAESTTIDSDGDGTANAYDPTPFVISSGSPTVSPSVVKAATLDSNGNGIPNSLDPEPFFVSTQVNLSLSITNFPPLAAVIRWHSIPGATNCVRYTTNIGATAQFVLTNFVSPTVVPPAGGWPITNVIYDVIDPSQPPRFYNVEVAPNSTMLFGQ